MRVTRRQDKRIMNSVASDFDWFDDYVLEVGWQEI